MTWTYTRKSDGSVDVSDHTGSVVTTLTNDGGGFDRPGAILDVMHDECAARNWDLSKPYVVQTLKDATFENIQEQ